MNGYTAPDWEALNKTETLYDALGRVYQVIAPDGQSTFTAYQEDANGTSVATLDANGHKRIAASDVFGRLAQVKEVTGSFALTQPDFSGAVYATTQYGYDGRDNLVVVTDTLGNTTVITYDGYGRKTAMDDPDMGAWSYAYDALGNLQAQTDAKGQTLWFVYDVLNRLTEKRAGGSTGPLLASFSYDQGANGLGRRTQATSYVNVASTGSPTVVRSWEYDARGRAVTETVDVAAAGKSFVLNYAYDAADRMTSLTYPADEYGERETVATQFDDAMRPVTLTSSMQAAPYAGGLSYNPLGQPTRTTFGNRLTRWNGYYGYESTALGNAHFGRLYQTCVVGVADTGGGGQGTCIGSGTSGATSLFKLELGYDAIGNITAWQDWTPGRETTMTFEYDPLDRLVEVSTLDGAFTPGIEEAYAYDAIGNLTQKGGAAQVYGAPGGERPHAVVSRSNGVAGGGADSGIFTYDANGNMTVRVEVSGTTVTTYTQGWTIDNRLAAVTATVDVDGSTVNLAVTTYLYDADGNRVQKTDPDGVTLYVGDAYEWYSSTLPVAATPPTGTLVVDSDYAGLRIRRRGDYGVVTFTNQTVSQTAGGHLSLYVGDLYQTAADYWVHAPDGSLITTTSTWTGVQGPDFVVDPVTGAFSGLPQIGTYTVTVKPRDNRRGRYSLLLSTPVMVSSTLEMRTLATATHVLTITRPAQDGLIEFTGQAGRDIAVDVLQADSPAEMTLYRPDGSVVVPPLGSLAEVMPLDASGVYTLRVNPLDDATGVYRLRLIVLVPVAQQSVATADETACVIAPNAVSPGEAPNRGVACWGSNGCSQEHLNCGFGPGPTGLLGVRDVESSTASVAISLTVTDTRLVTGVVNVDLGDLAGCALDRWGRHHCWGWGWGMTWGNYNIGVPAVNAFHPTSGLADIAHGEWHVCALTRRGDVFCGGNNINYGMLGIDNPSVLSSPELVQVSSAAMVSSTVGLASDYMHTCALLRDAQAMCWGLNGDGELGDGTLTTRHAPVAVVVQGMPGAPHGAPVDLALGERRSCALLADGAVACWGDDSYNWLGVLTYTVTGNDAKIVTPSLVLNQYLTATALSASDLRQCLRGVTGAVACWGDAGGFDARQYPWPVIGFETGGAQDIAADGTASGGLACIARSPTEGNPNGGVVCWGQNDMGQLGDGTRIDRDIPLTDTAELMLTATGAQVRTEVTAGRTAETIRLAFDGAVGEQYALRLRCPGIPSLGPSLYVLGPDRRLVASDDTVGCKNYWNGVDLGPLTESGRYVIEVRPYQHGTGVFTASLALRIVNGGEAGVNGARVGGPERGPAGAGRAGHVHGRAQPGGERGGGCERYGGVDGGCDGVPAGRRNAWQRDSQRQRPQRRGPVGLAGGGGVHDHPGAAEQRDGGVHADAIGGADGSAGSEWRVGDPDGGAAGAGRAADVRGRSGASGQRGRGRVEWVGGCGGGGGPA